VRQCLPNLPVDGAARSWALFMRRVRQEICSEPLQQPYCRTRQQWGRVRMRTPSGVSDLLPPAASAAMVATFVVIMPAPAVVVTPPIPRLRSHFSFPSSCEETLRCVVLADDYATPPIARVSGIPSEPPAHPRNSQRTLGCHREPGGLMTAEENTTELSRAVTYAWGRTGRAGTGRWQATPGSPQSNEGP
jgi:hypothetical protein